MYVTVASKKINYEVLGKKGPWVVFVHGWGGTHKSLRKLASLASRHYRALVFDLPGFGRSDNPDPSWGVGEYAKLVEMLLKELKVDNPVYFGHSFGGSLGIYLAAKGMVDMQALVLCASSYKRTGKKSGLAVRTKRIVTTLLPFLEETMARIRPFLYRIFFRNSDLAKYPHLERNFRLIVANDLTPLVSAVSVPTLIVWGGRDTATPLDFAHELHESIAGSTLRIYPHKSHNLPLRYPEDVWKDMRAFLGKGE
jgi:pimeloyl-ACP methyl ester carboxylesterase